MGFLQIFAAVSIYLFITTYLVRYRVSPEFTGNAIAYRCRSLPRVRRRRASKPQGSSSNGSCICITMDQLICAFLSHTHYWYEVGMLKVPAHNIYPWLEELHLVRPLIQYCIMKHPLCVCGSRGTKIEVGICVNPENCYGFICPQISPHRKWRFVFLLLYVAVFRYSWSKPTKKLVRSL